MPIPAGPGLPREPPSNSRVRVSFIVRSLAVALKCHCRWGSPSIYVGTESSIVKRHDVTSGRHDLVDFFAIVIGQLHVERFEIVLILFHRSRANDRAGHAGLLHHPREGKL